jgi:hypothetical protein
MWRRVIKTRRDRMLKIETEKIILDGEPHRKIISVSGLMPKEKLPAKYLKSGVRITEEGSLYIQKSFDGPPLLRYSLKPGNFYREDLWKKELLPGIKEAGERLHKLRQEEKKLRETWNGVEVFVI